MIIKELVTKITLDPRKAIQVFDKFIKKTVSDSDKSAKKVKRSQEGAAKDTSKSWSNTGRVLSAVNKKFEQSTKSTALVVRRSQTQAAVAVARQWEHASERMSKAQRAAADSAQKAARRATRTFNKGAREDYAAKMGKAASKGGGGLGAAAMALPMKMLGGLGVGYGAYRFGEGLFDAVGNEQMLMARLETVLGSRKAAEQKMKMISKFAEVTPYQKNDLAGGFSAIAGSGYQMTERDLTALGNVSAGSGKKSFAEMIEMLKSANRGLGSMVDNFDGLRASANGGVLTMQRFNKHTKKWIEQDFEAGDMAGIVGFVRQHGETNYAGQMEAMSKTIPGMASTVADTIAQRFVDIGNSGMTKVLTEGMQKLVKFTEELEPFAKQLGELGAKYIPIMIEGMKGLQKYAAPVAGIFATIATHMFGAKILGGIKLLAPFFLKSKIFINGLMLMASSSGGISAVMTALSMGAGALMTALSPLLIGGAIAAAIAAVGYVGYQTYKYFKEGEKGIEGLRNKFPALADLVVVLGDKFREFQPYLISIWETIKVVADVALKALGKAITWVFKYVSIPLLISFTETLKFILDQIILMADFWIPKLTGTFEFMKSAAIGIKDGFVVLFNYLREKFPWLDKLITSISNGISGIFGGSGEGGDTSSASKPNTSGSMLDTARQFAIGAPGQSLADQWAQSNRKVDGMAIKTLYKTGVACAASVEEIARQAGASQKVLTAMTPSVPKTYHNLINQGLAELVPYNQLKGGEIFYTKGLTHTGVVGEGGKTFLHAANSQGHKIGMGQRFSSTPNYLGNQGIYVRLKDPALNGGGTTIQQNITVSPGANTGAVKQAAKQGTQAALNSSSQNNQRRTTRR